MFTLLFQTLSELVLALAQAPRENLSGRSRANRLVQVLDTNRQILRHAKELAELTEGYIGRHFDFARGKRGWRNRIIQRSEQLRKSVSDQGLTMLTLLRDLSSDRRYDQKRGHLIGFRQEGFGGFCPIPSQFVFGAPSIVPSFSVDDDDSECPENFFVHIASDETIRTYSEEELLKIRDSHPKDLPFMITVNLESVEDATHVLENVEEDLKRLEDANARLKNHLYKVLTVEDFVV